MSFNCQYCQKQLKTKKSLKRHEKETCPNRPGASTSLIEILKDPKAEKLEIKAPKKGETSGTSYHCVDCGYSPITKGTETCPGCGEPLDWSAIDAKILS